MPCVVQPDDRQATRSNVALEGDCHPIGSQRRSIRSADHQAVIVVVLAKGLPLLSLGFSVSGQRVLRWWGEGDPAATLVRFRRLEQSADVFHAADRAHCLLGGDLRASHRHNRLSHCQPATIGVDVRPSQAAQLGSAQTRVGRQLVERGQPIV